MLALNSALGATGVGPFLEDLMALKAERVDTWAAPIQDRSGSLARKLNALTGAGANLEFAIARRASDQPGRVFYL